ncbi:MAG: hypothetical protein ACXVPL_05320 [Actinomycetota bacterium]
MMRKIRRTATTALVLALGSLVAPASATAAPSGTDPCASYQPQVPTPDHFVQTIDNTYFPLPVGRTLVYRGIKDGQSQIDRVTVTSKTKVIEGITATTVSDVATHRGSLLEKTKDWYAQDDQGNVWYLGEDTRAFLPNGRVDRSGSWESGVGGAKPGIIMEADPQAPDAYRQECLAGEAEDMAWVVKRGGSVDVPYGTVHHALWTLEFTPIEPAVVDRKVYGPGVGIVLEVSMSGGHEVAKLVRVRG